MLSDARPRDRPAIIGLAKSGGLGVIFRTEPAVRPGQRRVTAARLYVVDADVAGDPRPQGVLALHAAARRHRRFVGKQHLTYFAVLVAPAGAAEQGGVLLPATEFGRRDKAALPEASAFVLRIRLVFPEAALCRGFLAQRKSLAYEKLAQTGGFAFDGAGPDAPFLVGRSGTEIVAAHVAAADKLGELVARIDAARPGIGMVVNADLVDCGCLDAGEPIRHLANINGPAVPDHRAGGKAWAGCENGQDRDQPTHRKISLSARAEMITAFCGGGEGRVEGANPGSEQADQAAESAFGHISRCLCSVLLYDGIVRPAPACQIGRPRGFTQVRKCSNEF